MKKVNGFILTAALTLFFAGQAFTQSADNTSAAKETKQATTTTATTGKFVDANNNGICDHFEARGKDGKCTNFVDANGDGICDHCADCKGKCQGNQNCCGKGKCDGKGMANQHRNGCGGPCGQKQNPDKK